MPTREELLDRFEADWQSRQSSTIEALLAPIHDEVERAKLLEALVGIEVRLRRADGQVPTVREYRERFPELQIDQELFGPESDVTADTVSMQVAAQETATFVPRSHTPEERPESIGDYTILDELGRGGMGVVFKARQRGLDRLVALKVIRDGQLAGPGEIERFVGEARAAAKLEHVGIVPVFEVGRADGRPFFTMAYVEGRSLADEVRGRPMKPRRAAELVRAIADAVEYAHGRGVVHRDLKPSNVLLDREGRPRVMDFGLAKLLGDGNGMTRSGDLLGTPAYMPPEQARARNSEVGPRSDVYALGALFYHLLTGRPPFQAASLHETLEQVVRDQPVPPRQLNSSVPRDLETICLKCLEKDREGRYPSAAELRDDLARYLAGEPVRVRPLGVLGRGWRWCRRHPARAIVAGVSLLALTSTAALVVALGYQGALRESRDRAVDLAETNERLADSERSLKEEAVRLADAKSKLADSEREQRGRAEKAEAEAEAAREKVDRLLFDTRLLAANAALSPPEIDVRKARTLLDRCPERYRDWDWHYLDRLLSRNVEFTGHTHNIQSVRFSPDGTKLASSSIDKTVRIRDARTGETRHTLPCEDDVDCVRFSPDGRRLAGACDDHTVRLWDVETGEEVLVLEGSEGRVKGIGFSPDGSRIASGGWDKRIRVWDTGTGEELFQLEDDCGIVTCVTFSPDGNRIASGGWDCVVRVWDTETRKPSLRLEGHDLVVNGVDFSPDGKSLASASKDKSVRLWDAETGATQRILRGHVDGVEDVEFSPDGSQLASGSIDRTVRIWNPETGQATRELRGHDRGVHGVSFAPDGRRIASAAWDFGVRVWDLDGRRPHVTREGHVSKSPFGGDVGAMCVTFGPDGTRIASSGADKLIRIWNVETMDGPLVLAGHEDWVPCVCFSPDGTRIASASWDHTVRLWDATTGRELRRFEGHAKSVTSVCLNHDGSLLASAGADRAIRVWNTDDGHEEFVLNGHDGQVDTLCFHPVKVNVLASGAWDGTIRLWDLETGRQFRVLHANRGMVNCVRFDTTGERLVCGSLDNVIHVWDASSGKPIQIWTGNERQVSAVFFGPGDTRIVSGGGDGTVKIWDIETGLETATLVHGDAWVKSLSLAPNGKRIAMAGSDGRIRVWSIPDENAAKATEP